MRPRGIFLAVVLVGLLPITVYAGNLDAPAPPTDPGSAMYTLEDIYQRLNSGAAGSKRAGPFREPSFAPGSTMHTLDEIMGKAPLVDNAIGAAPSDVLSGRTFWGLQSGAWGLQTGIVPPGNDVSGADGSRSFPIPDGLYNGSKTATANDTDLVSGNIRSSVNIFGVGGDSNVVNTSTGDATAANILSGKKGWVAGAEVTGSITNWGAGGTITPGTTDQTVAAGYWSSANTVAGDGDLVSGNVRSGANIFGVAGDSNVVNTGTGDATAANILSGKKAWVAGAEVTGSITNRGAGGTITPGTTDQTVAAGYWSSANTVAGDGELIPENIRSTANIFGVAGDSNVVNTSTGDAAAADILSNKKAWVDGAELTGSITNRGAGGTITPGTTDKTVAAGYWSSANTVSGDADLISGNIRNSANIFGVGGDSNVVNTSTGDATVGDILSGKKAWVDGSEVTGTFACIPCTGTLHGARWCDNLNGTVTDMTTGLVWLKKADWGGVKQWRNSSTACGSPTYICYDDAHSRAGLLSAGASGAGLSDSSSVGDWRLPTKTELYNLANGTEAVRSGDMRAFTGVQSDHYWSSTTYATGPGYAWLVGLGGGGASLGSKGSTYYVWPVRAGQ